jgi:hypothetical protein
MIQFHPRRSLFPALLAAVFGIVLPACGNKQISKKGGRPDFATAAKSSQCLKIINGIAPEKGLTAVIMLENKSTGGLCSGTFMGDNVVFTAAHCMDNSATGGMGLEDGTNPVAMVHGGVIGEDASSANPAARPLRDIAILIFADNTSKAWRRISPEAPREGEIMVVAGYGETRFLSDGNVDGKVRYGYNTIESIDATQGILRYEAPGSHTGMAAGQESISGRGDSGGPIINVFNNGLIALTSGGDDKKEEDFYLFSEQALTVIEKAEAKGARINGVNSIRKTLGKPLKDGAPDTDTISDDGSGCL